MNRLVKSLRVLCEDEGGATMIEYALMMALIGIFCIGVVTILGQTTQGEYQHAADTFP